MNDVPLNIGVSALVAVYNEEKRISSTLQSLQWCDEVIVLDKYSNDRTVDIARTFPNVRILYQKNTAAYTSSEFDVYLEACKYKYSIIATASDVIHPALAYKIKELVHDNSFDYDVIDVPYRPYFLGICEKYSPWYKEYTSKVFKTSCLSVKEGEVHKALDVNAKSHYKIELPNKEEAYYHLTHQDADSIMERNLRYWRGERYSKEPISDTSTWVFKKTIRYFLLNSVFFKGKAAIALVFSYLSYYMMSYVYRWDYNYSQTDKTYKEIRKKIDDCWEQNSKSANI
jgi:glycosyltransferase involved in cell wall biosynthesis